MVGSISVIAIQIDEPKPRLMDEVPVCEPDKVPRMDEVRGGFGTSIQMGSLPLVLLVLEAVRGSISHAGV